MKKKGIKFKTLKDTVFSTFSYSCLHISISLFLKPYGCNYSLYYPYLMVMTLLFIFHLLFSLFLIIIIIVMPWIWESDLPQFSSVAQLCPTPWSHELQHARPPCPSPTPEVHPNSCPSSQWCHPAISSSVVPFSSCPNPSQHQSLFQWVNSSHEVAKVYDT